jgi:hypothetical protein
MTWKEYENKVLDYFTARFPGCRIDRNIELPGRLSKTPREIDILLTTTVFGCSMQLVIECKNWNSKLDVADIGTFIDKLNDVGISKGIIISKLGYSEGAYNRARTEVNVQLQVLNFENIPNFYGFWANAYRGHLGAIISAPNGWVVNSDLTPDLLPDMLGFLHPMEFTPRIASAKKHFMYFQIYPIVDNKDLKTTLKEQDEIVKSKFPKSKFKYWDERIENGNVTYRQIDYVEENYVEFTGAVECDDFFFYCVCMVPIDHNPDDLARLRYVMNELRLIKIQGVDPTNSHDVWQRFFSKIKKDENNAT